MYEYEKSAFKRVTEKLRYRFPDRIMAVYAFGSMVGGEHGEWSDFDVLVVKNREPLIENEIMSIFIEEELQSGIMFASVIKDTKSFKYEKNVNTTF